MKKTKLVGFAIAGVAALSLPLMATADHHGGKHDGKKGHKHAERFAAVDTNGDGDVSEDEIAAYKAAKFASVDANGDGALTQAEMDAHREAKRAERKAARFAAMDTDGSGSISPEEFEAGKSMMKKHHIKRKFRHSK